MAESELSVLGRQGLSRRIAKQDTLTEQIERSTEHCNADWQFTTEDTRVKLHQLYPSVEDG